MPQKNFIDSLCNLFFAYKQTKPNHKTNDLSNYRDVNTYKLGFLFINTVESLRGPPVKYISNYPIVFSAQPTLHLSSNNIISNTKKVQRFELDCSNQLPPAHCTLIDAVIDLSLNNINIYTN